MVGAPDAVEAFAAVCQRGPSAARVDRVDQHEHSALPRSAHIRDKIAASKAKGMWMGGTPPLGYRPDGRSLAIVEDHAALIRDIYRRYLDLGAVRLLAEALEAEGIRTPRRATSTTGRDFGGVPFSRGQLYKILGNPIYAGDIAHQGKLYKGQHQPIIDRETQSAVQALLSEHTQGGSTECSMQPCCVRPMLCLRAGTSKWQSFCRAECPELGTVLKVSCWRRTAVSSHWHG